MGLEFTPYLWPAIASAVLAGLLAAFGWRRRSIPGALPFAALMACGMLWALGSAFELASTNVAAKIFWLKFQSVWQPAIASAGVWFALDYGDLRRWLVRRNLVLLSVPPLLWLLLVVTNDSHHILWSGFSFDGWVRPHRTPATWIFIAYGFSLGGVAMWSFARLFWRSPPHRIPVALCLCGQIVAHVAYGLKMRGAVAGLPLDAVMVAFDFAAVMYACALLRFHLFHLIPIARGTVIDQMREGMLVLDCEERIMDLNPAAERILGSPAAQAKGVHVADLLPGCRIRDEAQITVRSGEINRHYAVHSSALNDRRGVRIGAVILLDDVTDELQAQSQLLEQHRVLATHRERERVARELHDTLGQVLGFIKMQAAVAEGLLERGKPAEVKRRLTHLADAAQNAQNDVREYILKIRAEMSGAAPLVPALAEYLRQFGETYGIAADLTVSSELTGRVFEPISSAQLLRIIQEALTNVRKHAGAHRVDVRIAVRDGQTETTVQDDGSGFDPALVQARGGQRFGLQVMQDRAEEVGGAVDVHSTPGGGTRVVITMPLEQRAN